MTHSRSDPQKSLRRPTAARRKRSRAVTRTSKRKFIDIVDLIDTNFNRRVTVTESGRPSRMTIFAAIYKQLWTKEMGGDPKALRARLKYEEFARKQQPAHERKIIVLGGLPERPSNTEDRNDV